MNINQIESTASEQSQALTITWQGRVATLFKPYAQYVFSQTTNDTSGHRFNVMGVLTLPRAFQTGLVLSVISGSPFNMTTGFDDNSDTVANDRPPGVTRNTIRGPATIQLDRFAKTFNIARDSLDFAVDVFNAINRTNVTGIVGV